MFSRPGGADHARRVDHRRRASRDDSFGIRQRGGAKIGVADGIHDHAVRWQGIGRIEEISIDRSDGEDPVIQPGSRPHIAAHRRNQHQQRNADPGAAKPRRDHGIALEALPPMFAAVLPQRL